MEIKKAQIGTSLILSIAGRLDAATAPELDKLIQNELSDITDLTFDLAELTYIASAGLRVLLVAQKRMNKQGTMKLIHVSKEVKEIFEMTGFLSFLTVEE